MKQFIWNKVFHLDTEETVPSLIEIEDGGKSLWVWGICHKEGDLYKIAVRSKDRKILRTIEELLPLEEAKLQIESKLLEDGIMREGDELKDYIE